MTIAFLFIPKLDNLQVLIFQILNTTLHFSLIVVLLYAGVLLFLKDRAEIQVKKLIIVGIVIEIVDLIIVFNALFIPIGGGIALLFNILILIVGEMVVLYLFFYEKGIISERKVFLLYLIACAPAFFLGVWITNSIFGLAGIEAFIFNFNILG